ETLRGKRFEQLSLAAVDVVETAERFQMRRPDFRDHANFRTRDRTQVSNVADSAGPQFEHAELVLLTKFQQAERQADLVVEVLSAPHSLVPRRKDRMQHFARRRLP